MDNKLSELSKPEQFDAEVEIHGGEPFAVWAPAVNGSHVKAEIYFALLAELEAKDERIGELEAIATEYAGKFQKAQDAAKHLIIMNDEDKKRISELESEGKVWESAATKHLERAEEAENRLATPVRLPEVLFIKVSGSAVPVMHAERVKERLRAAGFTVEGDE